MSDLFESAHWQLTTWSGGSIWCGGSIWPFHDPVPAA